jgi:alpha-mannosidase
LVVSAFKRCEFEDGYILRFYNITTKPVKGTAEFGFPVRRAALTGLDEEEKDIIEIKDGKAVIDAPPYRVITLKLEV